MGKFFYWVSLKLYVLGLLVASPYHAKARKMIEGRKGIFETITKAMASTTKPVVWVHCASLGEFEQARPVIDAIKRRYPHIAVVITFFSPSGYDVRKNYGNAEGIFYLPFDSRKNARKFLDIVKPDLVYFIKYEFWYYYLSELKKRGTPTFLISAIFRGNQLFFKPYGYFYRAILQCFDRVFVQNKHSENLLRSIYFENVTLAGDTRFDRVQEVSSKAVDLPIVREFKEDKNVLVIGSSWDDDIRVLSPFINRWLGKLKFVVAPHELSEKNFKSIENSVVGKVIRYSAAERNVAEADVLLIDNMGLLSSLYRFGDYAYIGGAFGTGLHNVLEAATYGVPVFFGRSTRNTKFREAVDLLHLKAAFEIGEAEELDRKIEEFTTKPERRKQAGQIAADYVKQNVGATEVIIMHTERYLAK